MGFLPRKSGKAAKLLSQAAALKHPVLVYESPYRVFKMLTLIANTLGATTPVVAVREISKVYEEYLRGTAQELAEKLGQKNKVQGEFVLIIDCFDYTAPQEEDDEDF